MKKILFVLFIMVSVCSISCDKDCPTPTYPVEGLWIGTFSYTPGTNTNQTPQYFSFIIKPNGSLIVESQDAGINFSADGNWSMKGDTLNCSYTYPTSVPGTVLHQSATAIFVNSGKLKDGIWYNTDAEGGKIDDLYQQGTFTMNRVN